MATKEKHLITIYRDGGLGIITTKGTLVNLQNHPQSSFVEFVPQGKRKAVRTTLKKMVIMNGSFPDAPSGLDPIPGGGSRSRYTMYDPRYEDEFNIFANEITTKNPDAVLCDARTDHAKKVTKIREGKNL